MTAYGCYASLPAEGGQHLLSPQIACSRGRRMDGIPLLSSWSSPIRAASSLHCMPCGLTAGVGPWRDKRSLYGRRAPYCPRKGSGRVAIIHEGQCRRVPILMIPEPLHRSQWGSKRRVKRKYCCKGGRWQGCLGLKGKIEGQINDEVWLGSS